MFRISVHNMPFDAQAWFARLREAMSRKNRYHPEKHYMRGPGPKTRAKHAASERANPLPRGEGPSEGRG
jgi:hypothetical protein